MMLDEWGIRCKDNIDSNLNIYEINKKFLEAQFKQMQDFSYIDSDGKKVTVHVLDNREQWCDHID